MPPVFSLNPDFSVKLPEEPPCSLLKRPDRLREARPQQTPVHCQKAGHFGGENCVDHARPIDPQHHQPRHQKMIDDQAKRVRQNTGGDDSGADPHGPEQQIARQGDNLHKGQETGERHQITSAWVRRKP